MSEVSFVITTGVDITEHRAADIALRSSEARYRPLIEGSLGMICTHDLEGRLLSINTHAAGNLGYKPEELIGTKIVEYIPPEHLFGYASYAQAIAERGEDQGLLYLNRKNGGVCVIAYRNKLLQIPGTEPFVLGHGIDITEKTDAENKLHQLMRQRESILESVGDGIYGMDMEGRVVFVNGWVRTCWVIRRSKSRARTCMRCSTTAARMGPPIRERSVRFLRRCTGTHLREFAMKFSGEGMVLPSRWSRWPVP
jgi:two-component system, OmpR family, sensor histidine kinase VicK